MDWILKLAISFEDLHQDETTQTELMRSLLKDGINIVRILKEYRENQEIFKGYELFSENLFKSEHRSSKRHIYRPGSDLDDIEENLIEGLDDLKEWESDYDTDEWLVKDTRWVDYTYVQAIGSDGLGDLIYGLADHNIKNVPNQFKNYVKMFLELEHASRLTPQGRNLLDTLTGSKRGMRMTDEFWGVTPEERAEFPEWWSEESELKSEPEPEQEPEPDYLTDELKEKWERDKEYWLEQLKRKALLELAKTFQKAASINKYAYLEKAKGIFFKGMVDNALYALKHISDSHYYTERFDAFELAIEKTHEELDSLYFTRVAELTPEIVRETYNILNRVYGIIKGLNQDDWGAGIHPGELPDSLQGFAQLFNSIQMETNNANESETWLDAMFDAYSTNEQFMQVFFDESELEELQWSSHLEEIKTVVRDDIAGLVEEDKNKDPFGEEYREKWERDKEYWLKQLSRKARMGIMRQLLKYNSTKSLK